MSQAKPLEKATLADILRCVKKGAVGVSHRA
jgi:hypothetical protein